MKNEEIMTSKNKEISDLKSKVKELSNVLDNRESTIKSLKASAGKSETLQTEITRLRSEMQNVDRAMDHVKGENSKLRKEI